MRLSIPFAASLAMAVALHAAEPEVLRFPARSRVAVDGDFRVMEKTLQWDAGKTAMVICDMWDAHTCPNAAARVAEMAPRVNQFAKEARRRGVLIVHCPSDTMAFYKDHPGRKLAASAPAAAPPVPLQRWCPVELSSEAPLPIDDSDGGCDCATSWKKNDPYPWTRQHPAIEIADGDAITESAEAYNLMQQRGIENVIVCGVHLNMCVLGRPFAIRQMVHQGKNVVLLRDLTDSLYNPAMPPHVSHFEGTRLMIAHVEKYWCPTITSDALLGGKPFRFGADDEVRRKDAGN